MIWREEFNGEGHHSGMNLVSANLFILSQKLDSKPLPHLRVGFGSGSKSGAENSRQGLDNHLHLSHLLCHFSRHEAQECCTI